VAPTALPSVTAFASATQAAPAVASATGTAPLATPYPTRTPAPSTIMPTQPAVVPSALPSATAEAYPTRSPTATVVPVPQALTADYLLTAWQPAGAHTLDVTLHTDTPETGSVALHIVQEVAANEDQRFTVSGAAAGKAVSLQVVRVGGQAYARRAGGDWTAVAIDEPSATVPELALADVAPGLLRDILTGLVAPYVGSDTLDGLPARRYVFPPEGLAANLAPRALTLGRATAEVWTDEAGSALRRVLLDIEGRDGEARLYRVHVDATWRLSEAPAEIPAPVPGAVTEGAIERPALVDVTGAASVQVDATLTITSTQPGTLALTYAFTSDPPAARVTLSVGVVGEQPDRLTALELDGRTWISEDGEATWQPYDRSVMDILQEQDLTWLLAPQDLVPDVALEPAGEDTHAGLAVARYAADVAALLARAPLGGIAVQEGTAEVWIAPQYGVPVHIAASATGLDAAGAPYALALTIDVAGLEGGVEIALPPAEALPAAPSPWPATLLPGELACLESLPAYRLFSTLSETSTDSALYMEMLHEVDATADAERWAVAARRDAELAFSDWIRRGDAAWSDDGGTGVWSASAAMTPPASAQAYAPATVLAALGQAAGEFVGTEEITGEEAGRYRWGAEAMAGLVAEGALDPASEAEVWISARHRVPVRVLVRTVQGASTSVLDISVTDIGAALDIRPPAEQPCPGAPSLQQGQVISATLAGGARACAKFVAPAGTLRTLDVDTADPRLDLVLTVFDSTGAARHYNDDGPSGYAPLLTFRAQQAGVYYAELKGQDDRQSGEYLLRLAPFDAEHTVLLEDAPLLVPGASMDAALTETSLLYITPYEETIYGHAYALEGTAGRAIRVTVEAGRLGSRLDPQVRLLDPRGQIVASDDDSLGGVDALLEYTLTESGRYYLVVNRASGELFGRADTHYYRITLQEQQGAAQP